MATNYRDQGARARGEGKPRESCRFKAKDIVRDWTAGWDEADARIAERKRKDAMPRWEGWGGRGWGENATPPTSYELRGDAAPVKVHRHMYADDPNEWFVSCECFGVDRMQLGTTDPDTAKRLAVLRVREILRERHDALLAISDPETGALLGEP